MRYRTLGKTGLSLSVIGIGTWQYGGEWGKDFTVDEVRNILEVAADCGINLIDTAECYGEHLSESLIGQAIAGKRDQWIIATKFGHEFRGFLKRAERRRAADVSKQLDESLNALHTDYIDLYQYHSIRDREFDNQALHDLLLKAQQAGKIRHIGNSIGVAADGRYQVSRCEWAGVKALQVLYNRLERDAEQLWPLCQQLDLGVIARVPLASGLLSGQYSSIAQLDPHDLRVVQDPEKLAAQLPEVQRIRQNELPAGINMAQWALAWCLENPVVTCVIPGCRSAQHLRSNAAAVELLGSLVV
jgi:aryl-alcohol dehydrogenase-like predicted oxidoreductase